MIVPGSGHDRVAIGPRSWVDRDLDPSLNTVLWSWKWFHDKRSTIAVRSNRDHGESSTLSDEASAVWTIAIPRSSAPRSWGGSTASRPIGEKIAMKIATVRWINVGWSRDQIAMAIRRTWCLHVSSGKPLDHVSLMPFLQHMLWWRSRGQRSLRSTPLRGSPTALMRPRVLHK